MRPPVILFKHKTNIKPEKSMRVDYKPAIMSFISPAHW